MCVLRLGPYLSAHRNHSLCVLGLSAELGVLHSLSVHLKLCQSLMVQNNCVNWATKHHHLHSDTIKAEVTKSTGMPEQENSPN